MGIIDEDGRLRRGKHRTRSISELSDAEFRGCVGGFHQSQHTTRLDREELAAELRRRSLPVPPGFVEGTAMRRGTVNGISQVQNGVANGTPAPEDHNGHAVASKSRMNGKAKRQNECQPADFIGEIDVNGVYTSDAFRARLRSGRGPMHAATLSDWVNRGLRVEYLPDGRLMIRGEWFLEWIERGCSPEPDPDDDAEMSEFFFWRDERSRQRRERSKTKDEA